LKLPDLDDRIVAEITVIPLFRHLQRAPVFARSAHADALRAVTGMSKCRRTASSNPLIAAVVLLMLLFQSFRHHFTDIVQIKSRKPRIDLILIIRRLRVRLGKPV